MIKADIKNIKAIDEINNKKCSCGREHTFNSKVVVGKGVISSIGDLIKELGGRLAYVICDINTYKAAGEKVCDILKDNNIKTGKYIFDNKNLEPNETSVGLAVMNFDPKSDVIVGVGSGVINDISKIVANISNKPYIIVATAPSMDGYASATSSMSLNGVKVSLPSKCGDVIIGDTEILKNAPIKMMVSGLGDMIAKYISICEWRISNLINDEYYCPRIAKLVRDALKKCTDNADGLMKRDEKAVEAVFEGLVIGGVAMKFAGLSRPASGVEHYISHIWDMRGEEFNTPVEFHGIQCALGTVIGAKIYEKLVKITPDREKAISFAKNFDYSSYCGFLREFLGKSAETMIKLEEKEKKYDLTLHKDRLDKIIDNWDKIVEIVKQEIPAYDDLLKLYQKTGLPIKCEDIGIDSKILPDTFKATKDIRDKYVLSRLCWDLGVIDEII